MLAWLSADKAVIKDHRLWSRVLQYIAGHGQRATDMPTKNRRQNSSTQKKCLAQLLVNNTPRIMPIHLLKYSIERSLQPQKGIQGRFVYTLSCLTKVQKNGVLPRLERGASRKLCLGFTLSELGYC
jgi:hypothetical protein